MFPRTDVLLSAEKSVFAAASRMDCVGASELCLKEPGCSTKYRTMRQCIAGKEGNISAEGRDECRSALDALKQSPLYNCRCKRGMKKEKNCLRIYWGLYQHLQGVTINIDHLHITSDNDRALKTTVYYSSV